MVVFYYTSVAYLDIALEIINAVKHAVKLHVVIEIAPESKATNILNVGSLSGLPVLSLPEQVLDPAALAVIQPYLHGTASAHFFVQQNPKTFSLQSWKECQVLAAYIKQTGANLIHFDTAKARALGLLPMLYSRFRNKVFVTIHDPVPHSGEFNWRNVLVKKSFFPITRNFLFYSDFSEQLFKNAFPAFMKKTARIGMHPYSFYRHISKQPQTERSTILFFGRISVYKGVDVFLAAIPYILDEFPEQQFIIAGSKSSNYELNKSHIDAAAGNLKLILRHISNEELVSMADQSKLVVCPYRDATQSGVLMTAFARHTGVIASEVGAFPEFIEPGGNGMLVAADNPRALADAIIHALRNKTYVDWTNRLTQLAEQNEWMKESATLAAIYKKATHRND